MKRFKRQTSADGGPPRTTPLLLRPHCIGQPPAPAFVPRRPRTASSSPPRLVRSRTGPCTPDENSRSKPKKDWQTNGKKVRCNETFYLSDDDLYSLCRRSPLLALHCSLHPSIRVRNCLADGSSRQARIKGTIAASDHWPSLTRGNRSYCSQRQRLD
jgi:hypothetical protein